MKFGGAFFLALLLLGGFLISRVHGGLDSAPTLPTRDQCMYFSDDNGIAQALRFDPVQGSLVEAEMATSNTSTLIDKGILINILENIGYRAVGLAIHKNVLYVASLRLIARFDLSNNLKRLSDFVTFAFIPFECLPGGIIAYNDILYLSCGAFVGSNVTAPMIKFSLATEDYGALLNTTEYPSWTINKMFFYQTQIVTGTFWVYNYLDLYTYYEILPINGTFAFTTAGSLIGAIPLSNASRSEPISDLFVFARKWGKQNSTHPTNNVTSEFWQGFSWGLDKNLYVVSTFKSYNNEPMGAVYAFHGETGEYIFTLVERTPDLANAVGIQLGPTGDFYVAAKSTNSVSHIFVYDRFTGQNKGAFFTGTPENDILPKEFIWGPCPTIPPEEESTDNTLTIVLATVLPVLGVPICCLILLILALIVYLLAREINDRRRRTYLVRDDEDGMERGRRSKGVFTYREIDPDELEIGDLLGEGAYGKVYKGTYRGAAVAIKTFDQIKLDEADEETLADIKEEAQMMERLGNHPNVINFVGAITSPGTKGHELHFSLVTEFCPNGSLYDLLIKKKARIPLIVLIRMARDIASGILHLHKERVIHRDIAARNILVGNDYAVYLSDFGMARIKNQEVNTTVANIGPVKWMAPESMLQKQYSEASDAFAYGVLLWEMVTRKVPWKGMDAAQIIIAVAQKNTRLEVPPDTDPILKKIISAVWRSAPEKRMTMKEIVAKLDAYYQSLEEVYENMSDSDDEGHTDRSYFKYSSSSEAGGSRSALVGGKRRDAVSRENSVAGKNDSTDENSSDSFSFSYAELSTGSTVSKKDGDKGKGKKPKDDDGDVYGVIQNYGDLSEKGKDKNYGEIPSEEKNYGDLPAEMHSENNYGALPDKKKKKKSLI